MRGRTGEPDHRRILEEGVVRAWHRSGDLAMPDVVCGRRAKLAVAEVLDALRHNPTWARSLGIGDQRR